MRCALHPENAPRVSGPALFVRRETSTPPCGPARYLPRDRLRPFRRFPADSIADNATLRSLATYTAGDHAESARKKAQGLHPIWQMKRILGCAAAQVNQLERYGPPVASRRLR